jgi:hypothetical protein
MKKRTKVVFSIVIILLILSAGGCVIMSNIFKVETTPYTVLEKDGKFEIRQYPSYLVAETIVDADFKGAGNLAFRRLFNYISGQNKTKESVSMTAPVNQESRSEKIAMTAPVNQQPSGEKYSVSFVMPPNYSLETLPQPLDPAVVIKEIPAHQVAAVRYSGSWSQEKYHKQKAALEQFMQTKGLVSAQEPVFARYDPPFQLWFLRRNEVLIPVK